MDSLLVIISLIGGTVGIVGGILGIVSWIKGNSREKRVEAEEKEMWEMLIKLINTFKEKHANAWAPEIDSEDHKLAEKMVAKGLLARSSNNSYKLAN